MFKNSSSLYGMKLVEDHDENPLDEDEHVRENKKMWMSEVAEKQLKKLSENNYQIKSKMLETKKGFRGEDNPQIKLEQNISTTSDFDSSHQPVFVDPTDYFDVKSEPHPPQPDFNEFFEDNSRTIETSSVYQANLEYHLDEFESSSDDESAENFEFILPSKKRKRKISQNIPKEPKPRPPKMPELPSNMEEVLTDPTRLPGGFKRGRYKVRSLTGVPYCKFCDTVFLNRKEKQAHVCQYLQCTDSKNYICRVCNKELSKQSFSSHYHDAAGCQYCGKKFLNPRDIKDHIENVHKGEEFRPPMITNSEVEEYVQKKLQEEGHIYEERAKILARNLEHTGPKVHTCKTCQESFRNPRSLARHARIHTDREKFSCEFCGKITFSKSNLLKHHQWVHKIPKLRENKKRSKINQNEKNESVDEKPKRSRTRKIINESSSESSLPQMYNDFDDSETIDKEAKDLKEQSNDDEIKPIPPITKIKSYLKAPLLPGNIKPGQYKIRNCTGVPFCKFCDTIFANRKEKQAHDCDYLKCDPKNFICRVCRKELSRQSFSSHIHESAGCQYCGKKILNPKDMKSHISAKHRNEEYKPPLKIEDSVVEEYIQQKLDKEAHVYELREQRKSKTEIKRRRRKNLKFYICDLCGEHEETKKQLEIHISTHIITIYKCSQCDETFDSKSTYKIHRNQHNFEIVIYHCDFCSKNFNSKENIRTHQKNIHGYGLKCEICKIPISSKEELMSHMRKIHEDAPCKFCGKMFLIPSKLKAHEIRHMVQAESKPSSKSYVCEFCKESFYNCTALNYHLRFHGAAEMLTCEFCGKNFPTAVNLKTHQARKHQIGISCEVCKTQVGSKEELKEHMLTHGSFDCVICSKSFVGPSKLKAHLRTHTKAEQEGIRVECDHCPRSFLPSRLRNHIFKYHNEYFDEWLANSLN